MMISASNKLNGIFGQKSRFTRTAKKKQEHSQNMIIRQANDVFKATQINYSILELIGSFVPSRVSKAVTGMLQHKLQKIL